jgi:hypothetical protein
MGAGLYRRCLVGIVVTFSQFALFGQVAPANGQAKSIVGVWRAQMGGLPVVTLTITDEGSKLEGALLFYLLRRDDKGAAAASPGVPEPLLNPSFDGKVLTFQISHRRAHPPGSLGDPPVSLSLTLTGANSGSLVNKSEASPPLQLTRSDY